MPRNHAYNLKTMNESVSELRKKTRQLDNYLGEIDWRDDEKISRVSWRNNPEKTQKSRQRLEEGEEPGIFGRIYNYLTCVSRENKPMK